jgi:predicted RNA-binding protein with PIN domain
MPYLLDGNNLIGRARGTARPSESDRDALVAELSARLRATKARAILFFDGPAGGRGASLGSLSIRRPSGGSADEAIVAEVARSKAPGEAIVVTSDRELQRRVRDAGGKVCSPQDFFARFGTGGAADTRREPAGAVDVDDWTRYFGDPANRTPGTGNE